MGDLTYEAYEGMQRQARTEVLQKYVAIINGNITAVALERYPTDSLRITRVTARFKIGEVEQAVSFDVVWEAEVSMSPEAMKEFLAREMAKALTDYFMRKITLRDV